MSQHQNSFSFRDLDAENFIAKRLGEHGAQVFAGATTPEIRKDRIRAAILNARLDCTIIGRAPGGKPETYAESFFRFYGEPLTPKRKGKQYA